MKRIRLAIMLVIMAMTATAQDKAVRVKMETSLGNIVVRLYDETPIHRDNFVKLVRRVTMTVRCFIASSRTS